MEFLIQYLALRTVYEMTYLGRYLGTYTLGMVNLEARDP